MNDLGRAQNPTAPAAGRVALYLLCALAPLFVASALRPASGHNFVYTLGLHTALAALGLVLMQVVLAARLRWTEWPFGLDILFRFHKIVPLLAAGLLVLHPILLAWGVGSSRLLFSADVSWKVYLGRTALLLLLVNLTISFFRPEIGLEFQKWRWAHNVVGLGIIVTGFAHAFFIGHDLQGPLVRAVLVAALLAIVGLYLYHKLFRSLWMRRHRWKVVEVRRETHDVTTVVLEAPPDLPAPSHWPGQFHFVNFHREPSLPHEEHHWTISTPPAGDRRAASTIKASGDFTATIPATRPGETAQVLPAYGRFSYVLYPDEDELVFIAGGIGITPLMAMIRHLHCQDDRRRVLLLCANKTQADIVFRDELDRIAASGKPELSVVHVLSSGEPGWTGLRGLVDEALLRSHCGPAAGKAFYVCAPPPMADMVISALRRMGVPLGAIHYERFSL